MAANVTYYTTLVAIDCGVCGIPFGVPGNLDRKWREEGTLFYCPNGHHIGYSTTENAKLRKQVEAGAARQRHLEDQLQATAQEAERVRVALLRDRHRFANGVCPCCNRSFPDVARHVATKHPDYDVTKVDKRVVFKCSCGRSFGSLRGLRTHQGRNRSDDWYKPNKGSWWAHLTVTRGDAPGEKGEDDDDN